MRHVLNSTVPRRISSVGARSLPTARVVTAVVQQPVHLSPMGNTVAMTVGAELPFASNRRIVISTQESGGVSKAPSYMQSRYRGGMFQGVGDDAAPGLPPGDLDATMSANDPVTTTAPATSSWDWSKIGQTIAPLAQTGVNIYQATRNTPQTGTTTLPVYRTTAVPASNLKTYLIVGGVAAVGLLAFMMLRKKSVATNPRRR